MKNSSAVICLIAALAACDNAERTAADAERWRLLEVQRIDSADGSAAYTFGGVVGAVRLDDGRLVVADRASGELRWFDENGRHLQSIAGAGDAGAFRELVGLHHVRGDSLAVFDALRLVHILDHDGTFGRTLLLFDADSATHSVFRLHSFFPDGGSLAVGWPQPTGVVVVDSLWLRVYAPAGDLARTLGPFPAVHYDARGRVIFSPITSVAAADDRIIVGYPDSFRIRVFDRDGTERARLQRPWTARPVTDAERGWYANAFLNAPDDNGAPPTTALEDLRRRALQTTSFASSLPAFRRILASSNGQVWVEHYHPEHELATSLNPTMRGPGFWSVFDLDSGWIADVEVPAGVRILEVGNDFVTGVQRDASGEERPVVMRRTG